MEKVNRAQSVDIVKGILIILVVVAHTQTDVLHDIIFMFHMPLFFMISGFLMKREKLLNVGYMLGKIKYLMIPYVVYLVLDMLLVRKTISARDWMYAIWGGRAITCVYWYITCYLFTLLLFFTLLKKFSNRTIKGLILMGGGIAVIESHLVDKLHLLQTPGIPWNLDVSLIALVYVGIGFFYKNKIKKMLESESKKHDLAAGIVAVSLALFCWLIYKGENRIYYFDMKPVYYKELISAILIPSAFGIVLIRLVHWMEKVKWLKMLNRFFCGRATIPIMFMHIPLNHWRDTFGYDRIMFMIIGIGVPLAFTLVFNKCKFMRKLFGLPKL